MKTAVVTGATRGIGRGVAKSFADAGLRVFATGRNIQSSDLPENVVRVTCDHLKDSDTANVFERVRAESGHINLNVNCAWGGYQQMTENGRYTRSLPFWEQPMHRWTSMIDAGIRAAFVASAHAAKMMVPQGRGLIVNLSYWAAQKYIGNVIYGMSKAATDKMTADMACELKPHNVAVVALYPGLVRTEAVLDAAKSGFLDLANSESPEFIGRVILALADGPDLMSQSGRVLVAATVAKQYEIHDVDGRQPRPLTLETA